MANRLKKMLTEEMVRLDPPLLSTPEEVIEYCGNILVENKKAKAGYVKEMIDSYQRFGPYMVMAPGLALPHARPGGNVKEPCISFVKLKEPVCFHHPLIFPVPHMYSRLPVFQSSVHLPAKNSNPAKAQYAHHLTPLRARTQPKQDHYTDD